eukprot:s4134_g5.t1
MLSEVQFERVCRRVVLKPNRSGAAAAAMLRFVTVQETAPAELKKPWEARDFDAVNKWVTKELGGVVCALENVNGVAALDISKVEKPEEVRAALARHVDLESTTREALETDLTISFLVDFGQQQQFTSRADVLKCLKNHSCNLRFMMTIPLRDGYQCKATAVGKRAAWDAFKESIGTIGRISPLTQQDEVRAAAAKSKLLDNVNSIKRAQEAAAHLARLLPPGGRPSKVRRTVTHLGEVLLLGSRVTAATVRSARESVADHAGAEEEPGEQAVDVEMSS